MRRPKQKRIAITVLPFRNDENRIRLEMRLGIYKKKRTTLVNITSVGFGAGRIEHGP